MKISIVTPSYNQGRFIERTLQSVSSQTGVEWDHYVADGGSTDETVAILESRGDALRWVSERDRGQAHAVNKGIAATDGEVIGWLNSDDVYYPDALVRVKEFFERNPHVDVLYGHADHIDPDDKAFEEYPAEPWDLRRLEERCFVRQPAAFIRRRVLEIYGVLDESLHYCMDYELWLRLGRAGAVFAYLPEKLAGSRLYPENKTLGSSVAVHREIDGRCFSARSEQFPTTGWSVTLTWSPGTIWTNGRTRCGIPGKLARVPCWRLSGGMGQSEDP